jgi:hypothetical protein
MDLVKVGAEGPPTSKGGSSSPDPPCGQRRHGETGTTLGTRQLGDVNRSGVDRQRFEGLEDGQEARRRNGRRSLLLTERERLETLVRRPRSDPPEPSKL